jgi:hypothetical protein
MDLDVRRDDVAAVHLQRDRHVPPGHHPQDRRLADGVAGGVGRHAGRVLGDGVADGDRDRRAGDPMLGEHAGQPVAPPLLDLGKSRHSLHHRRRAIDRRHWVTGQ